jgi:hypothetical protein
MLAEAEGEPSLPTDFEQAVRDAERLAGTEDLASTYLLEFLRELARRYVFRYARTIAAVALRLDRATVVTGDQIVPIVRVI